MIENRVYGEYVKPEIKFEEVELSEPVANTCWGYHGTGTTLYCDIPGAGYCSFQIGGGSCTLNLTNVTYYASGSSSGTAATADQQSTLEQILKAAGGESGNPFKGEGSTVTKTPDSSWS